MRILVASILFAAACGGPQHKHEGAIVEEGSAAPSTCCCKSTPMTSEDAQPVYQRGVARMECSTQQGTCVDDVQCAGQAAPPESSSGGTGVPPPADPGAGSQPAVP